MDLLSLQASIKTDHDGYESEFLLQYRHFNALLEIFRLKPAKDCREFGELATFVAQTGSRYPQHSAGFAPELVTLLQTHGEVLDSGLRRTLVQALILLRNRGQIEPVTVLPLFFQLFRCKDKPLRQMLFRHIVSDIKNANKKHRNERLNRSLQSFMFSVVADDNESAAKRSLSVLTELWRKKIWRDVRTVNVIATAAFHKSPRVMLAVLKFFLGQDDVAEREEEAGRRDDDDDDHVGHGKTPIATVTKEDIYKAKAQGTRSSKKKKDRKLKRTMATVKKASRKADQRQGEGGGGANFMALHLLHDPQTWAERLLARLNRGGSELNWESRLALMQVISRVTGLHKLILLNFYPLLQKYVAPHQRDGPAVLAALVQASHDLVPPDVLQPVLKQLVDQFINDKARPEVMTLGLKAARELCLRCPLIMDATLLQDLALYKKFRDKQVSSAARGIIGLFRELQPDLLIKKDRGRGADMDLKAMQYGAIDVAQRIEGADLLEEAMLAGQGSDEDEYEEPSSGGSSDEPDDGADATDDSDAGEGGSDDESGSVDEDGAVTGRRKKDPMAVDGEPSPSGAAGDGAADAAADGKTPATAAAKGKAAARTGKGKKAAEEEAAEEAVAGSDDDEMALDSDDEEEDGEGEDSDDEGSDDSDDGEGGEDEEEASGSDDDGSEDAQAKAGSRRGGKRRASWSPEPRGRKQAPKVDSIASLKKRVALAKAARAASEEMAVSGPSSGAGPSVSGGGGVDSMSLGMSGRSITPGVPIELDRFLTQEDFKRIANLKQKRTIEKALSKHGLQSASKAKRKRLLEGAKVDAEEAEELAERRAHLGEGRVRAEDLMGKKKREHDKAARLATVMEGREGRDKFGGAAGMKKKKTGGLSEREKQRKKAMPIAARGEQLKNRKAKNHHKLACPKNFKGRMRQDR